MLLNQKQHLAIFDVELSIYVFYTNAPPERKCKQTTPFCKTASLTSRFSYFKKIFYLSVDYDLNHDIDHVNLKAQPNSTEDKVKKKSDVSVFPFFLKTVADEGRRFWISNTTNHLDLYELLIMFYKQRT